MYCTCFCRPIQSMRNIQGLADTALVAEKLAAEETTASVAAFDASVAGKPSGFLGCCDGAAPTAQEFA
jgi:hypothetical protein